MVLRPIRQVATPRPFSRGGEGALRNIKSGIVPLPSQSLHLSLTLVAFPEGAPGNKKINLYAYTADPASMSTLTGTLAAMSSMVLDRLAISSTIAHRPLKCAASTHGGFSARLRRTAWGAPSSN